MCPEELPTFAHPQVQRQFVLSKKQLLSLSPEAVEAFLTTAALELLGSIYPEL